MSYTGEIKAYICQELAPDVDPDALPHDYNLLEMGVIDSLSLMRLIVWLEETYSIPISDIEIAPEDFNSVLRINTFISRHTPMTVSATYQA